MTQDWHTPGHISFASVQSGKKPFETIELPYGKQVLWPDHCVRGTDGAALSKDLSIPQAELIIRKGFHKDAGPDQPLGWMPSRTARKRVNAADHWSRGALAMMRSEVPPPKRIHCTTVTSVLSLPLTPSIRVS